MRWQYRITFAEGITGTCSSAERVFDCLYHFRRKFGTQRVIKVEERYGDGEWTCSELLPACQGEWDTLRESP